MKYGVCTNQPSLCRRAAARDLMPMPAPDTRCPEPGCGKPLLPAPGGGTIHKRSPSMLVIAIASTLVVVGVGGYFLYQRNQPRDQKAVTELVAPAMQPAIASPTPKPLQQPIIETPPVKPPVTPGGAATITPAPMQPAHQPVAEVRKSADRCNQANWAAASCDAIERCWQPESPSLSSCEGLSSSACSHIRICLGVAPSDTGPGVKN